MTDPKYENISMVSKPAIEIKALKNLCQLIMNSTKQFPPGKVKSKTRRKNGETTISSTSDYLESYSISHRNSSRNTKEIG
jgi:hypothetical protein